MLRAKVSLRNDWSVYESRTVLLSHLDSVSPNLYGYFSYKERIQWFLKGSVSRIMEGKSRISLNEESVKKLSYMKMDVSTCRQSTD